MYPTITPNSPKPSAPPAQQTPTNNLSFSLQNPNPNNQQSMQPNNNASHSSQPPYPVGQSTFPSAPGQTAPYTNQYASNAASQGPNQYASPYSRPQTGQGPSPTQASNPYPPNPYGQNPSNPVSGYSQPYSAYPNQSAVPRTMNPSSSPYPNQYAPGNPYGQPPSNPGVNPNPYQPTNPYGQPPQQQSAYGNPYQSVAPPQNAPYGNPYQPGPPSQNAPYGSGPQGGPYGNAYPGYAPSSVPYQSPYAQPPPGGPGYNQNDPRGAPPISDRLRAIAGRYEISDALAKRLSILQQYELVVLCDDSGSMNSPVHGTNGSRWDELRTIVQIIIEIGTIFDSNGVDLYFLNRPPKQNVTDVRQVIESFHAPPSGLTPLTPALRKIFQTFANRRGSDKRLLVFVATDGAPTDSNGNTDIHGLENLMQRERQANTTYVTFLACTDDDESVAYLSNWDRTMMNVDVVDDYKTERAEVQRARGPQYSFTFGDYVVKALLGAIDPQMDSLDESGNNNFRPY